MMGPGDGAWPTRRSRTRQIARHVARATCPLVHLRRTPATGWRSHRRPALLSSCCPGAYPGSRSQGAYLGGLGALLTSRRLELDPLPLEQLPVARALDRREVDEHVGAAIVRSEEPVPLGSVEPLHCAFGHDCPAFPRTANLRVTRRQPTTTLGLRAPPGAGDSVAPARRPCMSSFAPL